jgi:hypothetical protein
MRIGVRSLVVGSEIDRKEELASKIGAGQRLGIEWSVHHAARGGEAARYSQSRIHGPSALDSSSSQPSLLLSSGRGGAL